MTITVEAQDRQAPDRWVFNRGGGLAMVLPRVGSDAVLAALTATEARQRKRKGVDADTFSGLVDNAVANLLRCQLDVGQQSADAADDEACVGSCSSFRSALKSTNRSRYDTSPLPLGMLMSRRDKGAASSMPIAALLTS
jgi:hypothetical protein